MLAISHEILLQISESNGFRFKMVTIEKTQVIVFMQLYYLHSHLAKATSTMAQINIAIISSNIRLHLLFVLFCCWVWDYLCRAPQIAIRTTTNSMTIMNPATSFHLLPVNKKCDNRSCRKKTQTPIVAKLNGFYARTNLHDTPNGICIFIKFYDVSNRGYYSPLKNIKSPCKNKDSFSLAK